MATDANVMKCEEHYVFKIDFVQHGSQQGCPVIEDLIADC